MTTNEGEELLLHMPIPQPGGSTAMIPTFEPTRALQGLGVYYVPSDDDTEHINVWS